MDNDDVAKVLDEIADLLEIQDESRFRVQAYHRAANCIRSLSEDINEIYEEGRLQRLSAVGKGIAEKIGELLTKGETEYHEELKEKIPPSLVELIQIQSLGPRKAKFLYEELNIQTVDDLLEAIEAHKLAPLKGFGAKSEENILRGVKQFMKGRERILLSEAYPMAERIINHLKEQPFVLRIDMAGSLRRMKETIGDIDLLAASREPSKAMDHFCRLPEVDQVLAKGETKSSILAKNGLQVDLRVVTPEQYGSALQYFTGSKEHSIHLRDIAKKRGLKINEYGLFEVDSDTRIAGEDEEEIYSKLNMQYIPPFMREDKGEIELAIENRLPKLVEPEDIKGDLHVHSSWSDGLNKIEEIAETARAMGYSYVAICDHAERLKIAGGLSEVEVRRRTERIRQLNEGLQGFTILAGIELNIDNDGKLDYGDDLLQELDVVVASIHAGFNQPPETLTGRILAAISNPYVDIIAHPTGRIMGKRPPYPIDLNAVFKAASATGTFLELNSFPDRLDLRDDYLREAKAHGVKIAVNTDAHTIGHLRNIIYGVATAKRGWLEPDDVINTYPLDKLLGVLKSKSKR